MFVPQSLPVTRWLVRAMLLWALICLAYYAKAQPSRARQSQAGTCTLKWLEQHQAARENNGKNRGPLVDAIIKAGGGVPAQRPEWCGFTQAAANRSCGLPIPRNGMQGAAAAWFPLKGPDAARTLWDRKTGQGSIDSIAMGLKAGFDYGRGIHHVAAVAELGRPVRAGRAPRSVWTWAGNEGTGTAAGLKRSLYPIGAIDALSNWNY